MTMVEQERHTRLQRRMLIAVMLCYLTFYTGRQTFGFAIPGIQEEFPHISKEALGWASTALLWSYGIGQFINGNLADKFGGRRTMSFGAISSTVANWVVSFATGFWSLLIPWGVNGFLQSLGWAPGSRILTNWWSPAKRGVVFAWYVFAAGCASVLSFVTSLIIVETLALDWRWIFRLPVLLLLITGIMIYFVTRDRPSDLGLADQEVDATPSAGKVDPDRPDGMIARYRDVLGNIKILITGFSIGFQNLARYGLLVWAPVHFLGEEEGKSGWVSIALPVGMAVGALSNGYLSDKFFGGRRSTPIAIYMALGAVATIAMFAIPTTNLLAIPVLFLAGFFVYGPQASFWALCPDLAGARRAGTATGVVNFFAYLFAGIGEPIIGGIMDRTGDTGLVFPVAAGACALSALVAVGIRR